MIKRLELRWLLCQSSAKYHSSLSSPQVFHSKLNRISSMWTHVTHKRQTFTLAGTLSISIKNDKSFSLSLFTWNLQLHQLRAFLRSISNSVRTFCCMSGSVTNCFLSRDKQIILCYWLFNFSLISLAFKPKIPSRRPLIWRCRTDKSKIEFCWQNKMNRFQFIFKCCDHT